jgi:hypothetical protein
LIVHKSPLKFIGIVRDLAAAVGLEYRPDSQSGRGGHKAVDGEIDHGVTTIRNQITQAISIIIAVAMAVSRHVAARSWVRNSFIKSTPD